MFYFIKESSGYIQIRTLAAPDQNTNGIAIYTDTSINQTPTSQAHSSKKKKEKKKPLCKIITVSACSISNINVPRFHC